MRHVLAAAMAISVLVCGAMAAPAQAADDQNTYYNACVRISPAMKTSCACRAQAAMKYSSQLRADIILSMTNPGKYAAKARQVSHAEIEEWEHFSGDTAKQCRIDN